MNKPLYALSAAATALLMAGCAPEQDATGEDNRQALNGLAVDGRVAGGKVWADMNNNNRIDDFEPYAHTDADGYYSYNPVTDTNYCSFPIISDEYQRHCLIYGASIDSIVIRIKGGTDLSTGERLKGVMSMASSISSASVRGSTPLVLSPITTLLQGANSDSDRATIRSALSITSDADLRLDFSTASDAKSKKFLANSVAVQTMMDVLVSSADEGTNDTATHQMNIIDQISTRVAQRTRPPAELDHTDIGEIGKVVTANAQKRTTVSSRLSDLNIEIKRIEQATSPAAVGAQLRASEVVGQLIKKETTNTDSDAVKKVLDSGIGNLTFDLNTSMSADNNAEYDIASVTNSLVDSGQQAHDSNAGLDSGAAATAVNSSKLATDTVWGGQWFVLEATEADSDDLAAGSYIAIRLDGDADSGSGRIGACVNVTPSDTADSDETFTNEYVGGRWSKISAGVITLVFDYEGQEFEGQMKAKADTADTGAQLFRFTSDIDGATEQGDLRLSANGVSALANVARPGSASDCANKVNTEL